jgi:hypothetical protein
MPHRRPTLSIGVGNSRTRLYALGDELSPPGCSAGYGGARGRLGRDDPFGGPGRRPSVVRGEAAGGSGVRGRALAGGQAPAGPLQRRGQGAAGLLPLGEGPGDRRAAWLARLHSQHHYQHRTVGCRAGACPATGLRLRSGRGYDWPLLCCCADRGSAQAGDRSDEPFGSSVSFLPKSAPADDGYCKCGTTGFGGN